MKFVPGVHAFAVPLRGSDGRAGVSVCPLGTPERFGEERLIVIQDELVAVADALGPDARRLRL